MANWRTKSMPLAAWVPMQEHFGDLQLSLGGPDNLAMFSKTTPGDPLTSIFITGPGIEAIEAISPGGWQDSSAPSGEGVALLVGAGNAWEYFGIEQQP